MFREIILPIFRSTRLCVTVCGIMHPRCCWPVAGNIVHLVGCLHYLCQWCTVKQISDNEIYLLIKYIKCVLWRVAKCLSYIEEARCLKVNPHFLNTALNWSSDSSIAAFCQCDCNGGSQYRKVNGTIFSKRRLVPFHASLMHGATVCSGNMTVSFMFFPSKMIVPGMLWVGTGNSKWMMLDNDTEEWCIWHSNTLYIWVISGAARNEQYVLENNTYKNHG